MWIALSSAEVLCGRDEGGDFDLALCTRVDQARDVEQRRGRKILPQGLAPGRTDTGTGGFVFPTAGQVPGQANDVLRSRPGLRQELDDPSQRNGDLRGHIGLILALLVASGLAGQP